MANTQLFQSASLPSLPSTTAINAAGGAAYSLTNEQALAQYAATGCLHATYYADAREQLDAVLGLAFGVDPLFVARTAVFAREQGFMKDMPALLCAVLAFQDCALLERVFDRVIDNGRMLRNFVQIVRSGVAGRRSFGSRPKRIVQQWLERRTGEQVFFASLGNAPSLADILKMVHPKPQDRARAQLYGYLLGKPHDAAELPACVRQLEDFLRGRTSAVPDVPFQFLTSRELSREQWLAIAKNASWQTTRMNLNTFLRHRVFASGAATKLVAQRLADRSRIAEASVFPYQIMTTLDNLDPGVPRAVRSALESALDASLDKVPELPGKTYVAVDVSGSMHAPITGARKGATTKVRCIDVAALCAAAILRRNRHTEILPFHEQVVRFSAKVKAPVLSTAKRLAALPSGGTNCSAVLHALNQRGARGDLVVMISDQESWIDAAGPATPTSTLFAWHVFKQRNPQARLVCIDLQPHRTVQAPVDADVVHVGGFSDHVFDLLATVVRGAHGSDHWVDRIREVAV